MDGWRMKIAAIDPGYQESAFVVYDTISRRVVNHTIESNDEVLNRLFSNRPFLNILAIETIEGFGMAVGREVFETVWWSGRFYQLWQETEAGIVHRVPRKAVKIHLCGNVRATDANIRVALMDKFGVTRERAIGTIKSPGPLYGIKKHEWSALAIAVTLAETQFT